VSAFHNLALTADGVLGWERGNLFSDAPKEKVFTADFRHFRDLAAASIAFKTDRSKKDAKLQLAFVDVAKGELGSMKDQDQHKFPAFERILDHDTHIPKLALRNMVRKSRRLL
jgi:hypothetical protein